MSNLPPTENAAIEHLKRVYFQVQLWLGNDDLPEKWGWENKDQFLTPIKMTQAPAPESLLKNIFCNCQKDCTAACGCRKSGLYCTQVCGGCQGSTCLNSSPSIELREIESEEEII